jgi:hypothetical protein
MLVVQNIIHIEIKREFGTSQRELPQLKGGDSKKKTSDPRKMISRPRSSSESSAVKLLCLRARPSLARHEARVRRLRQPTNLPVSVCMCVLVFVNFFLDFLRDRSHRASIFSYFLVLCLDFNCCCRRWAASSRGRLRRRRGRPAGAPPLHAAARRWDRLVVVWWPPICHRCCCC